METASIRTPRTGASCGDKEKSMNIVPMTYKNKESRSSNDTYEHEQQNANKNMHEYNISA